jgi:hypothetical protein
MHPKLFAIVCLPLICVISLLAEDDPKFSRPSLKGLKRFSVSIQRTSTDETRGFLTEDDLRAAIESKLRAAGIRIDETKNTFEGQGANLAVKLTVIHPRLCEDGYAFNLEIEVAQPARLLRNPSTLVPFAVT